MKPWFTFGLRDRLILLILAAFGGIFAMIVQHTVAHRNSEIDNAASHLLVDVNLIASRQQLTELRAEAILKSLMTRAELRPGTSAEACAQFLAARVKQDPTFFQIGKALPNGEIACAAVPAPGHINVANKAWFQQALKSEKMVVSAKMTSRIVNKPIITFAKAMHDDAGRVTGVFFLTRDRDWLQQELANAGQPEEARLAVVDSKGMVIARYPDPDGHTGQNIAQTPLFQAVTAHAGPGSIEELGVDGMPRIIAFTPLLNTVSGPLTLWLSVPKAVVVAPIQRELITALSIAATILLLVMALTYRGVDKLLVSPLRMISLAVARLGTGDLAARTGLSYAEDDVGRLAQTFDTMAGSIQTSEQKLARANHALRVISSGNRILLDCKTEQELTEAMCLALVLAGDYILAWVGYVDERDRSVRLVASWNVPEGFFDGLNISCDETASGLCQAGMALRRDMPVVSNNIPNDPDNARWRERAQRYGYAASLALPLRIDSAVIGVLNIYAAEPDAFDAQVIELLSEGAADLAFGIAALRDEAEQARAQSALKTAEDRFSAAVNASLDALFILKSVRGQRDEILDFEFVDLNVRAEQLLGKTRREVVGHKFCELRPTSRTDGFFDKFVDVVATGNPLDEEFAVDTPEIKAKWLRHQVVRLDDGIAISSRDITEWKEAAAEIRRQNKLRTMILKATGEGISGVDLEGRTTFINPAGTEMLQWTEEELIGKSMHALHHHTRADGTPYPEKECPIYAAYRDGEFHRVDSEVFWRKDGSNFPVDYVSTPVIDDEGVLAGAVVSFIDISERKARENELAAAVRALKTLSEINRDLVRAVDEPQLLQDVCRSIVETGKYRMAWVGYADDNPGKTVTPMAWAGAEEGYLAQLDLTWTDTERGQAPISRAIRSGEAQVCHDIRADSGCALWHELAKAHGYAANFSFPLRVGGSPVGALSIYSAKNGVFDKEEIALLTELGNDLAFGIENLRTRTDRDRITYAHAHHAEILLKSLEDSIRAIAYTVEMRDPYTAGHERRVGELAVAIAREMGLSEQKIHGIQLAATVHDLGKINIPAEILSKPGKLSDVEFMLIQTHPLAGYNILKDVEFPWPIAEIVLQHHEKLDGSGYPQGLKGDEIMLESRIMTVADVVEAMTSHRPYRPGLGIEAALKEIERGRGSAYDETVADACFKLFREGRFSFQ